LRETINEDIIGWISIPGTIVDSVVVQTVNNTYYEQNNLYHRRGQWEGAIFLDFRNDILRGDWSFVVYGHNMQDKIMFHGLRGYVRKAFFDNARYILFDTMYEDMTWEIFSVMHLRDYTVFEEYNNVYFEDRDDFFNIVSEMKERSLYDTGVEVSRTDRILVLSTCDNIRDNGRYIVCARLLAPDEVPDGLRP
jgi:sortase B